MSKEMLSSESFKERNERFLRAITGDYEQELIFTNENKNEKKQIKVNVNDQNFDHLSTVEKILAVRGLISLRAFHRIYTDYSAVKKLEKEYGKHSTEYETSKDFLEMVEQNAVETAGTYDFPGLKPYIQMMNAATFDRAPAVDEVELSGGRLKAFKTAAWQYLNKGEIKGEFGDKELQNLFEKAKIILNQVNTKKTTNDRVEISIKLTKIAKELIDEAEENNEDSKMDNPKGEEMNQENEGQGQGTPDEAMEQEQDHPEEEQENEKDVRQSSESTSDTQKEMNEEIQKQDKLEELKQQLEKEIEEMQKEMEQEEESESEGKEDANEDWQEEEIEYAQIHEGAYIKKIHQFSKDRNKYKRLQSTTRPYARSMIRRIQNLLRYNEEEKRTGEMAGHLTQSELWRKDGKVFSYKRDKNDEAELAIAILVDESGSMGFNERSRWAREAAVVMAEVCEALDIPLSVLGHTASFHNSEVQLRHYIGFEKTIKEQKENLTELTDRNDNRDGMAIQYAGEYLLKQPQKDKLLLVIADGLPEHRYKNYNGNKAKEDCTIVVDNLRKKGITSIGIAIGEGQDEIATMFKHFISIPKLEKLPTKLVKIIEKNIFRK